MFGATRLVSAVALFGAVVVVGCSDGEVASSQVGHATETRSHAAAVAACRAGRDAAMARAESQTEMNAVVGNYLTCLEEANDQAVPQLERNLAEVGSYFAGEAAHLLQRQRNASADGCEVFREASGSVGGSIATLNGLSCMAELELGLAVLIEEYAWLGEESSIRVDETRARSAFPGCYQAYDKALEEADFQNAYTEATYGLAACVEEAIVSAANGHEGLIELTAENFPDVPVSEIKATVEATLAAMFTANGESCALLTEAGENGGGSLARTASGACKADAAWFVHEQIEAMINAG